MRWRPLGRRVLVKPVVEKASELILVSEETEPVVGVVEDIGDGVEAPFMVGERVFFRPYMGAVIVVEGEEMRILHEDDILAWSSP